jgi:tricorn protease
MTKPETSKIGLPGVEFEVDKNGYYKIGKIYKGENWHNYTRSPLTEIGIKAAAGNYVLEIDGKQLKLPENPYRLLQRTLNKTVTLTLNDKPSYKGSWKVKIKPIPDETQITYLTWVQKNYDYVNKKTNGRIGYIHVPDMTSNGLNQFVKSWYHQRDKEGIIIDDRYNGGGSLSSVILERLRKLLVEMRYSRIYDYTKYYHTAYPGHLAVLVNNYTLSDGENFAHFFRKYGLGPVIGTRTWGGVVGYYEIKLLMDDGYEIIPASGPYSMKGEWWIENIGVIPDITIDTDPVDQVKDRDPQLDKAIEIMMKKIEEEPVKLPLKPADPIK